MCRCLTSCRTLSRSLSFADIHSPSRDSPERYVLGRARQGQRQPHRHWIHLQIYHRRVGGAERRYGVPSADYNLNFPSLAPSSVSSSTAPFPSGSSPAKGFVGGGTGTGTSYVGTAGPQSNTQGAPGQRGVAVPVQQQRMVNGKSAPTTPAAAVNNAARKTAATTTTTAKPSAAVKPIPATTRPAFGLQGVANCHLFEGEEKGARLNFDGLDSDLKKPPLGQLRLIFRTIQYRLPFFMCPYLVSTFPI